MPTLDKTDYISIKDFAERAGVSRQGVYQRLTKDLSEYCQVVDGKKVIHTDALALFADNKTVNEQDFVNDYVNALKDQLADKQEHIETLTLQLAEKDKQIAGLQAEIANKGNMSDKLAQMLENQQKLNAMNLLPPSGGQAEPRRHWWQRKKQGD